MTTIRRALALGIAALSLLGVASLAFAQDDILEAHVPFAFHVSGKPFPAGRYEFRIDWADRRVAVIGGQHAPAAVVDLHRGFVDTPFYRPKRQSAIFRSRHVTCRKGNVQPWGDRRRRKGRGP